MPHPAQSADGLPAVSEFVLPPDSDLALLLEADDAVRAARKQRHDEAALLTSIADSFVGTATFAKEHARALAVEEFVTRWVRAHWVPAITLARKAPRCHSLYDLRGNTIPERVVAQAFRALLGPETACVDALAEEEIASVIRDLVAALSVLATRGFDLATLGELFASLAESLRASAAAHQEQFEHVLPVSMRPVSPRPMRPKALLQRRNATPPDDAANERRSNRFCTEGGVWALTFGEKTCRLAPLTGFEYLRTLLRRPCESIGCAELFSSIHGNAGPYPVAATEAEAGAARLGAGAGWDEAIDPEALGSTRERLTQLSDERDAAEATGNTARLAGIEEEEASLRAYLNAASHAGRIRRSGPDAKARTKVTGAIKRALHRIKVNDPDLAEHLEGSLRGGMTWTYQPRPEVNWVTEPPVCHAG